jgi:hypothetical protein
VTVTADFVLVAQGALLLPTANSRCTDDSPHNSPNGVQIGALSASRTDDHCAVKLLEHRCDK